MYKNTTAILDITALSSEGAGIARHESGIVTFVVGTAVGDKVNALIIKEAKDYLVAKPLEIITPSPDRVEVDCESYNAHCGGCVYRHIGYESEKLSKLGIVRSALRDIDPALLPTEVAAARTERYRNKAAYPVDENLRFGYYAARSHRVVPHTDCALEPREFSEVAAYLCELCRKYGISGYNETTCKGVLRHIFMRVSRTGDMLLMPVVNAERLPHEREIAREITNRFGFIKGICVNVNRQNTNVITGDTTYTLWGEEYIGETLCGKQFLVSAMSFFQVNPYTCELLYGAVKDMARGAKTVLDLYCGIGTIGLTAAPDDASLCGVEVIPEAIADAKRNTALCGRNDTNTHFVCGDASVGVKECVGRFGTPDLIIVDPPRKGLSCEVIDTVATASPQKVIYVSCNPFTLGRDLALFKDKGYAPTTVKCFDMFPRTGHVETVVLMSKVHTPKD